MTKISLPSCTILVVDVPESAMQFLSYMGYLQYKVYNPKAMVGMDVMEHPGKLYDWCAKNIDTPEYIDGTPIKLPPGSWEKLGRLEYLTEEQARGIVESGTGWYGSWFNYETETFVSNTCYTALESLHSLLKANQTEGNPLLLIDRK